MQISQTRLLWLHLALFPFYNDSHPNTYQPFKFVVLYVDNICRRFLSTPLEGLLLLLLLPPWLLEGRKDHLIWAYKEDLPPPHIACLFKSFLLLLFFKRTFLYLFYVYEYFFCMYVCIPCTCLVPEEFRKSVGSPESGVADDCEPPCGCWETNPGPLEELSHLSCPLLWHSKKLRLCFSKLCHFVTRIILS